MLFKQVLVISALSICSAFASTTKPKINIIYTNDMEGSIATCGCAVDPGGGVERRVNWYKKNNFSPLDTIYINSGSTLFSGAAFMEYEAESLKVGAAIMADSLCAMNIDAYTPGAFDLKMGKEFFKTTTSKNPVLITNSTDDSFLKEVKIIKNGYNVRIFGITTEIKELATYDAVKALKKYTIKKGEKDIFILLADTSSKKLNSILKSIKNIDVVLSSSPEEQLTKPGKVGNTTILRLLKGGDSIAVFNKENNVIFLGNEYSNKNEFTDRIKKYEKLQQDSAPDITRE